MPQNDGISSRVGNQQQSNYGAQQLSYFDQDITRSQPHVSITAMSDPAKIDSQSHPIQSAGGSPPPNPTPTPGSSLSGSTSLGISDQSQGLTSLQYSVSVGEGIITKPYDDTNTSQTQKSHTGKAVDASISHTQEGKSNPTSFQSAIKLMVSNNVAGAIIGRAGQTISDLQTQSSARIKLSQAGDYYPGTQDRVCLVQGQLGTVKHAVKLLLERFYMLQEQQHTQHSWQPRKGTNASTGFDFVVRLLVPSSSCGMIIGKGGANIKHMEESSGVASVRLSPKEGPDQSAHPTAAIVTGTQERVVTLTGPTLESCVNCIFIVIDCMFANHEICRYTNMTTSYSRHVAPGSYAPVQPGRPLHLVHSSTGEWENQGPYGSFAIKRSSSQPDLSHVSMEQQRREQSRIPTESFGGNIPQQEIGQRDPTVQQIHPSFMDPTQSYNSEVTPMIGTQDRGQRSSTQIAPMYLLGASAPPSQLDHSQMQNSSSAPDLLALQCQDTLRISNSQTGPVDYNDFASQLPEPTRPGFTAQVLIPDNLIGSILGRGGSTLNELQLHSNTRIRISQRGEYVPGTRNRIVTIRGQTAHSVSLAQYLMSQRMVLPPTAGFSGQSAQLAAPYVHSPQLQQPHGQRLPIHQPSHIAPVNAPTTPAAPQQQALHETSFLPSKSHPTATPSLSLALNGPD
jgi:RNA-binding protein Nova